MFYVTLYDCMIGSLYGIDVFVLYNNLVLLLYRVMYDMDECDKVFCRLLEVIVRGLVSLQREISLIRRLKMERLP
jgi:hypothetical protein